MMAADSGDPDSDDQPSPVPNPLGPLKPIMATDSPPQTPGPSSGDKKKTDKERKIGHRRVDDEGQVTYKKIQSTQIMGSIQLGIGHAVGSLASKPERDLLMKDFMELETVFFPKEGSNTTPAHHYSDFKFKVYAPIAFRYFRDLFGIQPDDFLLSLCNEPLRELSNPGASGSVFYLTEDDNFIIKTVQHKEAEFLLKLLPGYYMNLNQNPRTLLPKFFGQYCYICGGKNVRIIAMNNLLPSDIRLHQKYDLKGSTYKRKANKYERKKDSPTFKDLDFMEHHPDGILLESECYNALIKTMQRDCRVLESFKIMDYSLLVGVHNLDQAANEKQERVKAHLAAVAEQAAAEARARKHADDKTNDVVRRPSDAKNHPAVNLTRSKSFNKQRIAAYSTAMESIQADIEPIDAEDDIPVGGIPARNSKGERLLLYIGIIDILQSYRLKKKLEHTWKAMLHDGDSISVHKPGFYAQRFLDFMAKKVFKKIPSPLKHSPSKRKGALPTRQRPASTSEADRVAGGEPLDPKEVPSSYVSNPSRVVFSSFLTPQHHKPYRHHADPLPSLRTVVIKQAASKQSVKIADRDVASLSQIALNTESDGSVTSSSSATSSGLGSTLRTVTWTPPHSVGTSTPTHTEGTASLTESSESGDFACPTTPVKGFQRHSRESSEGEIVTVNEIEIPKAQIYTVVNTLSPIAEDNQEPDQQQH